MGETCCQCLWIGGWMALARGYEFWSTPPREVDISPCSSGNSSPGELVHFVQKSCEDHIQFQSKKSKDTFYNKMQTSPSSLLLKSKILWMHWYPYIHLNWFLCWKEEAKVTLNERGRDSKCWFGVKMLIEREEATYTSLPQTRLPKFIHTSDIFQDGKSQVYIACLGC